MEAGSWNGSSAGATRRVRGGDGVLDRVGRLPTSRTDALFELCDALLCRVGPVRTLVGLALGPEHGLGRRALYSGLNQGRIDVARLRWAARRPPRARGGCITVVPARRRHVLGLVVLTHLWPGPGQTPDGVRQAVPDHRRTGDPPHVVDGAGGRDAAHPRRKPCGGRSRAGL
ncbi:transposase [Streptomyces cyaneofuscatus]|uniref:transposase n=1 Tax=Streptomyces cyaneofuscatus TaxID=66883 RepID=UPI0037FC7201